MGYPNEGYKLIKSKAIKLLFILKVLLMIHPL